MRKPSFSSYRPANRRGGRYIPRSIDKFSGKYLRNNDIKAPEVRVVVEGKESLGVLPIKEALEKAQALDKDLVMIVPKAVPPVCRIVEWQKFRYECLQKEKEQRKKQRLHKQKEIKIKSSIEIGDLTRKLRDLAKFMDEGRQVKITVIKKGRQHQELYKVFKEDLLTKLAECSTILSNQERGRNLIVMVAPVATVKKNVNKNKKSIQQKDKTNSQGEDKKA